MNYGEKIREARQEMGLTQKEVAEVIGITENGYQKIEYGENAPNVMIALTLANIFNRTVEELFLPKMSRAKFVEKCGELLCAADSGILRCDYEWGLTGNFAVVTFKDKERYDICIKGGLMQIAAEIFTKMASK